ncbi:GspH/FimT family pseudopilin [Ramlibacter tataouinensis]|uniref:prepilin-type N-terminal cleavage/methylation domain-containing protein n=1 Tax=Ramlibacter tataouinensis TaxID=94132 RepID=UPI0022F3E295|nr:GspH/FimT family pseudopilin [Ramlibacter tataouinensis]WBY03807.1 GspH/FimT family pseudopilin [Ramlibacter tataouinensis]
MRTSAPGSESGHPLRTAAARTAGFTLIELLVVVAIIAAATAGVSLALRDSSGVQLEREGQRLAALFESARAQSRSSGRPVVWHAAQGGFRFEGLPEGALPDHWLDSGTVVQDGTRVVLGPEPIIGRQEVLIASTTAPGRALRIGTDGVRPFEIRQQGVP